MKRTGLPMALIIGAVLTATVGLPVQAQDRMSAIATGSYEYLATGDITFHAPGAGVLVLGTNTTIVGQYRRQMLGKNIGFYDDDCFHAINLMYDTRNDRHRVLSLFSSSSDRPVAGGRQTFQAATVYGYEVVQQPRTSIVLGGGLAVSDFGIETPDGAVWPLLPVPFIQASYTSSLIAASFDCITGPNVRLTPAPEHDFRVIADARLDQFRDLRDLIFEIAVAYRPLSIGIANKTYAFDPAGDEDSLEIGSYVVFATLDLTLVTLTGGYAVDAWHRQGDELYGDGAGGLYLSVHALIPLSGAEQ